MQIRNIEAKGAQTMNNGRNPDSVGEINLRWPISFAALLIIVGSGAVFGFFRATEKEAKDTYFFGSSVATAVATGISAFYIFQSIRHNTAVTLQGINQSITLNEERNNEIILSRTLSYIVRWNSSDYISAKKVAAEIREKISGKSVKEKEEELDKFLNAAPERKQEIAHLFNFLEELCMALNHKLIDAELSKDFFRWIVIDYYGTFSVFIARRRTLTGNDRLYKDIEDLASSWKNGNGN